MLKKLITFYIFLSLLCINANANPSETISSLLVDMRRQIYTIGETSGGEEKRIQNYQEVLKSSTQKAKDILASEHYSLTQEQGFLLSQNLKGINALHLAAKLGYYNIVEVLIEDHRYKPLISEKNADGFTPLDLAKSKHRKVLLFLRPDIKNDVFSYISFVIHQGFYTSPLKPYEKTIDILKKHNAKSTISLVDYYKHILSIRLALIDDALKSAEAPELIEKMAAIKNIIKNNIAFLDNNASLSENELSQKVLNYMAQQY